MAKITTEFRQSALRRGIVVKAKVQKVAPTHIVNAAVLEMANLGFIANPVELAEMSTDSLTAMLGDARTVIGADRDMTPIYPGFPKQVEDLPTLTLLVEQIMHYWTGGAFLPNYPTIAREGLPLEDMLRNARAVKVMSAAATARDLTRQLATSPIALSEDERALMKGAMELQHPDLDLVQVVAKDARNGENLQTFVKFTAKVTSFSVNELVTAVAPHTDNVDQLLRVLLALASKPSAEKWEDNYVLAVDTLANRHARAIRMGNLSRPTRRVVVERVGLLTKDFKADSLVGRQDLWRVAMRAVHPYDFKLTDAQRRAADIIHSNTDYRTLNSLVEEAMENGDVETAVELMSEHQPGNLVRRIVALLRLVVNLKEARLLADAVETKGVRSTLTTLISAYNGVLSANDENARVTRVAGLNNTMVERKDVAKVKEAHLTLVLDGLKNAMVTVLKNTSAPTGPVKAGSTQAVPLVRRDAATADRVLDRGEELALVGDGDVLRIFGHWNNNQNGSGYMDIGAVVLDDKFNHVAVSTWDTYSANRDWSTYSGDKHVYPGDSAAEYIDVKLGALRKKFPQAAWVAMTVQSYSGWPTCNVDFIAGAMLRSDGKKGEVFDARSVATAFKPTTASTQAVPLAVNLETGKMVWLDSSNGSTASGASSSRDTSIGAIVYDELARPRLTFGELASLWAEAHDAKVVDEPVDRDQLLALLG